MVGRNTTSPKSGALRAVSVCICVLFPCAAASAYPDLDWKLYDEGSGAANRTLCFYEEHTIDRTHRGVVRVWTKCLARSRLDAAGSDHLKAPYSRAIIDLLHDRRVYGYVLPILSAETLSSKETFAAIKYEAVADLVGVSPQSMMFHDLDCRARRARLIRGIMEGRILLPSSWTELPFKGPDARLRRLLCT